MLTVQNTDAIRRIEAAIGYTFRDKRLLVQVFTRKTYMKIDPEAPDNEVLEFYGDMLLSYHVTTYFVEKFAHMLDDGLYFMRTVEQFTEMRSHYVRNQYLTDRIKQLIPNIERLVRAQNPRSEMPKDNQKAYADLFESLVGAVYLDSWRDDALIRTFILRHLNLEPKVAPEAPPARGTRTLPRVDISAERADEDALDDIPDELDEDHETAIDAEDDTDGDIPLTDTLDKTVEAAEEAVPAPMAAELTSEEPESKAVEAAKPEEAKPEDRGSRTIKKAYVRNDISDGKAIETATPVKAEEPDDASDAETRSQTKREELEAYCRALGYEAPAFSEMPPNAPNARPVASCTLKYRDGRGKPVKISLNDSGKTVEEALEKSASKMLKKLLSRKDIPSDRQDRGGKADTDKAPAAPTAPAPAMPAPDAATETAPTATPPAADGASVTAAESPAEVIEVAVVIPAEVVEAAMKSPAETLEVAVETPAEGIAASVGTPAEGIAVAVETATEAPEMPAKSPESPENPQNHRDEHRGFTVENRGSTVGDFSENGAISPANASEPSLESPESPVLADESAPTMSAPADAVEEVEAPGESSLSTDLLSADLLSADLPSTDLLSADPEQLSIDSEEEAPVLVAVAEAVVDATPAEALTVPEMIAVEAVESPEESAAPTEAKPKRSPRTPKAGGNSRCAKAEKPTPSTPDAEPSAEKKPVAEAKSKQSAKRKTAPKDTAEDVKTTAEAAKVTAPPTGNKQPVADKTPGTAKRASSGRTTKATKAEKATDTPAEASASNTATKAKAPRKATTTRKSTKAPKAEDGVDKG